MKNLNLRDLLKQIDIKSYINQNLSISDIAHKVRETFFASDLGSYTKEVTPYIIEQFIKEELALIINPNKDNRKDNYWVADETKTNGQIGMEELGLSFPQEIRHNYNQSTTDKSNPKPTKEVDLLKKALIATQESKGSENSITLDFINTSMENNVQTILKVSTT